ncbi:hypothetical protein OT109_13510 [Phycisphaeraceae bacterium D3-23]
MNEPSDAADNPVDGHEDEATPADALSPREQMALALDAPVSVDYRNTPLEEVFADLREKSGINLTVDWLALEVPGIDPFTGVTLRLDDVPARTVLDYTLQLVSGNVFEDDKAGYRVGDELLEVTTLAELKSQTEVRVYDISAALGPTESLLAQFESRLVRMARANRRSGGGGGGLFADDSDHLSFGIAPPVGTPATAAPTDRLNHRPRGTHAATGPALPAAPATPRLAEAHPEPRINSGGSNAPGSTGGGGGGGGLFGDDSNDFDEEAYVRDELVEEVIDMIYGTVGEYDEWLDDDSTVFEQGGALCHQDHAGKPRTDRSAAGIARKHRAPDQRY